MVFYHSAYVIYEIEVLIVCCFLLIIAFTLSLFKAKMNNDSAMAC